MLTQLAPSPGDTVLELAAGTGDTGFEAAGLVGEDGLVITSDSRPRCWTPPAGGARSWE